MVKRIDLHRFVDKARVHEAITATERQTSAPIHVSLAPYFWGNVRRTAERAFRKRGLERTPNRNGVLFFVVPSRREFAIIGDIGAHEALGQPAWEAVVELMQERFSHDDATGALIVGIDEIGRALGVHFPP